jgi:hypothetical protein
VDSLALKDRPALKELAQRIAPILRRNAVVRAAVFGAPLV